MKKKNLIILLIIPFVISLLGIMTINVAFSTFYGDITSIDWDYDDVEAFSIFEDKHLLSANAYNSSNAPLDSGNQLVWKVENKDPSIIDPLAEIVIENGYTYLVPKGSGEVIVTCSNLKGNIFRKMVVNLYDGDGVIVVNPEISSSQNNIDSTIYYGEYDLKNGNKVNAEFSLKYKVIPDSLLQELQVTSSKNVTAKIENGSINVTVNSMNNEGEAYVKLSSKGIEGLYNFDIVKDGVNVYTYNDLLNCTNKSQNGEIVVLRKSFEALTTYNNNRAQGNVELFGNYNQSNKTYSFSKEVYKFKTTYNNEYIKQWNQFAKSNNNYSQIDDQIIAGLRVQKDFYGNGYTINLHNLTYPSTIIEKEKDGVIYKIPTLSPTDLFRGPLPFYTLGDPNSMPLVTAFGQDNVGMYIDGDNITVNDVNIKNCDIGASIEFLETVGTVLEINGDNNTIKNSRISNGKNVVRSFSSNNVVIDNSLISNSMNFLLTTGSNEYIPYDEASQFTFTDSSGNKVSQSLLEYLSKGSKGDAVLNSYLKGDYTNIDLMKQSLQSLQNAMNVRSKIENNYKGSMVINDTYFYNSGLASICFEALFNGPFLYSASPTYITDMFSQFQFGSKAIVPYTPTKVSGMSYPVKVELEGKTRFYDYKEPDAINLNGLIDENISTIVNTVLSDSGSSQSVNITIDDIFPIKPLLLEEAKGCVYHSEINVPVAYYGGALNLSTLSIDGVKDKNLDIVDVEIDFLSEYLQKDTTAGSSTMQKLWNVMMKSVTVVTGFEPFKFGCVSSNGYLYGETPDASDLIANAQKGE